MLSVTYFGTCRVHNPLSILAKFSLIRLNNVLHLQAYSHTTVETLQQIRVINENFSIPRELWPFAISSEYMGGDIIRNFDSTDIFIVEISSNKVCFYGDCALRFYEVQKYISEYGNTDASDSECTFMEKLKSCKFCRQTLADLKRDMQKIVAKLDGKVIFVTHINARNSEGNYLPGRQKLIEEIESYSQELGVRIFNPTLLVRKYGQSFALLKNGADINHYSSNFFQVVACHLYENYLAL